MHEASLRKNTGIILGLKGFGGEHFELSVPSGIMPGSSLDRILFLFIRQVQS
jgi:hypothetical protein